MKLGDNALLSTWKIDESKRNALYKQLATHIKSVINSGDIVAGYIFPTFRQMSDLFSVSRNTVATCLDMLVAEGYLVQNNNKRYMLSHDSSISGTKIDWQYFTKRSKYNINKVLVHDYGKKQNTSYQKYKFINNNDFNFTDIYMLAVKKAANSISDTFHYYENGNPELLEEIVKHLEKKGIHAKPSQILITQNEIVAMYLLSIGLLNSTSTMILPSFNRFRDVTSLEVTGTSIEYVKSDKNGIIIDDLFSKINNAKKSILCAEPSNNTLVGITATAERNQQTLDMCVRKQVPIIEIDFQSDYLLDYSNTIKSLDTQSNVIYQSSLGSFFSYNNSLGYVVASEYIIEYLAQLYTEIARQCTGLSQAIYLELLKSGTYHDYLEQLKPKLYKRLIDARALIEHYLSQYATVIMPNGGVYISIQFNKHIDVLKINIDLDTCSWFCHSSYDNILILVASSCTLSELEEFIAHLAKECRMQVSK